MCRPSTNLTLGFIFLRVFSCDDVHSECSYKFGRELCLKSTGVVRKVDELGRIVMPIELRRTLGIQVKDPMEIYVDGERIVLAKYEPSCVFCESVAEVAQYKGKPVCASCIGELQNALNQG